MRKIKLIAIDEMTMARARNGDMSAWNTIYKCCEKPMYSLALRMVNNRSTAEDMVQDSFLKVMEKIEQYRGDAPFWGWVRRILCNHCISFLRKNSRWLHQEESQLEKIIDDLSEQFVEGLNRDMNKLFSRLPEHAQRVVYFYVVEGMTHLEIAELFGQSQSFSKSIVSRSLKSLRGWMK